MRSGQADEDSFSIFSDAGDMIGGAVVFDRKHIEINHVQTLGDAYRQDVADRMREFAEVEARRLGMVDE